MILLSAKNLVQYMKVLISLHHSLNKLAVDKTEYVKKGDMQSLQDLLKEENKLISQVRKAESLLTSEAKTFLQHKGVEEEAHLSNVLPYVDENEQGEINQLRDQLLKEMMKLKEQNELNQDLLQQSLQFVEVSLDLLQPDIEQFNYDRNEGTPQTNKPSRSIFDSKA